MNTPTNNKKDFIMMKRLGCLSVILALAACGGGGSSGTGGNTLTPVTPTTSAEGIWKGTTNNGRSVAGVVLDDGTMYVLYSSITNKNLISGAFQGSGVSNNGSFAITSGLDFSLEGKGILATSVSGSYAQKSTLNGTITYPSLGQNVTFTTTYSTDYDIAPSLATIAGKYVGATAVKAGSENANIVIDAAGAITATGAGGCRTTGTATPRTKGNVYNVTVTYGTLPCATPGGTVNGIGFYDAATKNLYVVALNSAKTDGMIFTGFKQ